jgi:hypothetical protein
MTITVLDTTRAEIGSKIVPIGEVAKTLKDMDVPPRTAFLIQTPEDFPVAARRELGIQMAGANYRGIAFRSPRRVEVDVQPRQ